MIVPVNIVAITKSDSHIGICSTLARSIFKPTKAKTKAIPYFKYSNFPATFDGIAPHPNTNLSFSTSLIKL